MEDGSTLKANLESAERQRPGAAKGLLNVGYPPHAAILVWAWYVDLSSTRQWGGMGSPMPIPHAEILAWCQLHGIVLEPWQLRAIRLLDGVHLKALSMKGEDVLAEHDK